ncbi:PPOX class F420-dependent oxidoreductase [Micromonospora musae]|uniref:PPOX class F420-dependent oxidoreductase n=1 Tax=Micromonospora musae TaxID=1894970 RepID=UPI001F1D5966|nr:PPOX class F420-dependent oxidoreductase [Micromonospora musae]
MTGVPGPLADQHRQKPTRNLRQEMTTMLNPDVRRVLDSTPIAHLASVLPDGAPHSVPVWIGTHGEHIVILTGPGSRKARNLRRDPRVALSLTPADNPAQPIIVRGRVIEWLEGDAGWTVIDQLATKYIGQPYSRSEERVVAVIEPERQTVGIG